MDKQLIDAVSAYIQINLGGCSQIAQHSKVRVSRCLDTSSTTQMAEIMSKHWTSRIVMGKTIRRSFIGTWMGESTELGMNVRSSKTRIYFGSTCGWHQNGWQEAEHGTHVEEIEETCGYWRTHIISWPCVLGMHSPWMQNRMKPILNNIRCLNQKLPGWEKPQAETVTWSYDMEGHAQKCVERYCELANKKVEQFYTVSSPCFDDHHFKQEELDSIGELLEVCSQIVLKCLYLARIGRPDMLWSVNKLARSVTTWTQSGTW